MIWVMLSLSTEAIILFTLPPGVKFHITSSMIQFLNLKDVFVGLAMDDANMNLINIIGICTSYTIRGVDQEAFRLTFFLFSLTSEVLLWLGELPWGSITAWNEL